MICRSLFPSRAGSCSSSVMTSVRLRRFIRVSFLTCGEQDKTYWEERNEAKDRELRGTPRPGEGSPSRRPGKHINGTSENMQRGGEDGIWGGGRVGG